MPASRLISLEGGCNFRDLGGYETTDGRRVRQGHLYRSGVLAYFTPRDHKTLSQLGIRAICDLRRDEERLHEPTKWPNATDVELLHWDDERDHTSTSKLYGKRTSADTRAAMLELYRGMPLWLDLRLRGLFECVAAGGVPMLFHCSAGKDRTGLAAALLLSVLGVPRDTILADYAMTNEAVDLEQFLQLRRKSALGLGSLKHPLLEMPEEARGPMLRADTDYLAAALAQIESEYRSVDSYLSEALGVNETQREQLKGLLLTD